MFFLIGTIIFAVIACVMILIHLRSYAWMAVWVMLLAGLLFFLPSPAKLAGAMAVFIIMLFAEAAEKKKGSI